MICRKIGGNYNDLFVNYTNINEFRLSGKSELEIVANNNKNRKTEKFRISDFTHKIVNNMYHKIDHYTYTY